MRVESNVDASGVFVFVENFLPVLAAVDRAEDAALSVGPIGMAESSHENDIGIIRINDDFADGARVGEANILPGLARVERLVDSVALRNVAAYAGFARAHINNVVIGIGHRQAADRS